MKVLIEVELYTTPVEQLHVCAKNHDLISWRIIQPIAQPEPVENIDRIYDAIEKTLIRYRLTTWVEDDIYGNDGGYPLVDHLCRAGDQSIESGKHEVRLICDAIYNDVLTTLYTAPPQPQAQVPDGYVLAPREMIIEYDDLQIINFHMGSGQHADDCDSNGVLYIGKVKDDDGKEIHGLHIYSEECPEEGASLLVGFPELALSAAPPALPEVGDG